MTDTSVLTVDSLLPNKNTAQFKNSILSQTKTTKITLEPRDLRSNYNELLIKLLKQKYEGQVLEEGYIIPGTINLLSINSGGKIGSHFTGKLVFELKYSADFYVPNRGTELVCQVLTINKFGVVAQALLFPSEVVIPRQLQNDPRLTGESLGVSFLATLNKNDLVTVKIIDYTHKSNSLVIVGVVTNQIASSEQEFKLENRVIKLNTSLLDPTYSVILNETKIDNRAINPFKWLSNSLQRFREMYKSLDRMIEKYNQELRNADTSPALHDEIDYIDEEDEEDYDMSGGVGDDEIIDDTEIIGDDEIIDNDEIIGDDEIIEEEVKGNVDHRPGQDLLEQISLLIKAANEIDNSLQAFTSTNKVFRQLGSILTRDLAQFKERLEVLSDNLENYQRTGQYHPLEKVSPLSTEFETKLKSSGFSFFDNQLKNDIESLQNRLGVLQKEEKALTGIDISRIWRGVPREGIYGLQQIINPYELVDQVYNSQHHTNIGSRAYFKYLEMDREFGLTDDFNNQDMISYHIAEGPGGFVHAIADRRSKSYGASENDKYIGVTRKFKWAVGILKVAPDDTQSLERLWKLREDREFIFQRQINKKITDLWSDSRTGPSAYKKKGQLSSNELDNITEREFYDWLYWASKGKIKDINLTYMFDRHYTNCLEYFRFADPEDRGKKDWHGDNYSRSISSKYPNVDFIYGIDNTLDNGDIMNNNLLFDLAKDRDHFHKVNIVTADGGFEDESTLKELNHAKLFFHEILWALTLLQQDGHFVLKIYDIYWQITYELIGLLSVHFNEVYLYKPKTSRQANSEKYVVCKYFKEISDDQLATLRNLSNEWQKLTTNLAKYELSDNGNLTISYGPRASKQEELKFFQKLNRHIQIYKALGYIEKFERRNETYIINLDPQFLPKVKNHTYRLESLFFMRDEKTNLVNKILNGNFNPTIRDLITGYQDRLYINQLTTLNRGVGDLYNNVVASLTRRNLIGDIFKFENIDLSVSNEQLAKELLKQLNDDAMVNKLNENAQEWIKEYA